MQLLILAHAQDAGAQAVADLLAPRWDGQLMVLRPEWLGECRWTQRLDASGQCHTVVRLPGGTVLDSHQIGFVWNRIRTLPLAAFRASPPADRDYAGAELQALVASWLAELGSRAEPLMRRHAVVTPMVHHLHWTVAASRCGLRLADPASAVEAFTLLRTPAALVGVAGQEVHEALLLPALMQACHALAGQLGLALLELGFSGSPAAPALCRIEACPALASAEEVRAVACWLARCAGSPP